MHTNRPRLTAALLVVSAVPLLAACGNSADQTSSSDDDRIGTTSPVAQVDAADHDPGTGDTVGSGVVAPAPDDGGEDDRTDRDEPEPRLDEERPELGRPEHVVPDIRERLQKITADGHRERGEVLEMVEPLDRGPSPEAAIGLRDGRTSNEAGELNHLDEAAALACGDVERALSAVDDGDYRGADDLLVSAGDRASQSGVDDIVAWSTTLTDSPERTEDIESLLGFLSVCTRGGYEL